MDPGLSFCLITLLCSVPSGSSITSGNIFQKYTVFKFVGKIVNEIKLPKYGPSLTNQFNVFFLASMQFAYLPQHRHKFLHSKEGRAA